MRYVSLFLLGALVPGLLLLDFFYPCWFPGSEPFVTGAALVVLVAYTLLRPWGKATALSGALFVVVYATGLYFGPSVGEKRFLREVRGIARGMSKAEVASRMESFDRGHPYTGVDGYLGEMTDTDFWHWSSRQATHCAVRYAPCGDDVLDVKRVCD